MKKIRNLVALIMALAMAFTMFASQGVAAGKLLCDVNGDSAINAKDVLLLKQYLANWSVTIDNECSDVNADGTINAKDLLMLRQVLANAIEAPTFADEQPTEGEVGDDYPEKIGGAMVNQLGYTIKDEKVAKIVFGDSSLRTAVCYLVNAETDGSVFTAETGRKRYDSTANNYVADFDFSEIVAPGSYYVATPMGRSYTFEISENPYQEVQDALITALYYNRCGTALDASIVGEQYAHDVCHTGNKKVTILNLFDSALGKYKDNGGSYTADQFSGGLHDAGDYGRYVLPGNQVVASSVYAAELFPNGVTTNLITDKPGENISDSLDEARYEMEWILKMQNPTNGGVYFRLVSQTFAGWTDRPDSDANYDSYGLYCSREMLKTTAGMVGNAASCYTAFKGIDLDFANRCLAAARKGYEYVKANMNDSAAHRAYSQSTEVNPANAGEYGSSNSWGEIWYAASALLRATGETVYKNDASLIMQNKTSGAISFSFGTISGYDTPGAGSIAYLLADNADATIKATVLAGIKTIADNVTKTTTREYFSVAASAGGFGWGSNAQISVRISDCATAAYFLKTNDYDQTILDNISFILGRNHTGYSFVTKFGSKTPQRPHHRPCIAVYYANSRVADPIPGWLVGGISGNYYVDADDNYQTNEVCIYWNTPFIYAISYILDRDAVD